MKAMAILMISLAGLVTIVAGWALAGIEGSKHDFSNQAWSKDDVCGACHTPHRAEPPKAAPLWEPGADLSRRFGYGSAGEEPAAGTLMCMWCHDGSIASDITGSADAGTEGFINRTHAGLFAASGRSSEHPVGVTYPRMDRHFWPVTSVIAGGAVSLPNGRVECTSCHDPHNDLDVKGMLVKSNDRSALCLTCHKK